MNLTRNIVAGLFGVALVWATFFLAGWQWGLAAIVLLALEGWALANPYDHDTISDIIRVFSRKQLLTPWLFGFAFGATVASGAIDNTYVIAALSILQGHFFFTLNERREEAIKQEVKAEIKEEKQELKAEIAQDRREIG